jgi:hypothetical protein
VHPPKRKAVVSNRAIGDSSLNSAQTSIVSTGSEGSPWASFGVILLCLEFLETSLILSKRGCSSWSWPAISSGGLWFLQAMIRIRRGLNRTLHSFGPVPINHSFAPCLRSSSTISVCPPSCAYHNGVRSDPDLSLTFAPALIRSSAISF